MSDQERARTDVIKSWFNGYGDYGFILPEGGGEPVFVHHARIAPHAEARSLKKGARVSYKVTREKMAGVWAKNVCLTD